MKTFKRHRSYDELKAICKEKKWKFDSANFDEKGHDHIQITYKADRARGTILVNMVNGRFFGTYDGTEFSSDQNLDHEAWFNILLETIYIS